MGQIQSGINQIIGQFGLMARLSPELSAKAEKRAALKDLDRKTEVATEQQVLTRKKSTKAFEETLKLKPEQFEGLNKEEQDLMLKAHQGMANQKNEEALLAQETMAELASKRWDLDPTEKNLRAKMMAQVTAKGIQGERAVMDKKFEALRSLLEKGRAQIEQKYSFQDLINDVSKAEREGYING